MDWLPASIFSVVIGIIAFFLKKTYTSFESKMSELRRDSDSKMTCLREDFQQESKTIREDFRISMNSQIKRIDKLEDAIRDMPYKYTLKEDFIRSMSAVDKKLDRILTAVGGKEST